MTGVTEAELMRGHERQVRLDDLTEIDRRRLMHERIRIVEAEREELREHARIAAEWMLASLVDLTDQARAVWRATPAGLACTALETIADLPEAAA